MRCGRRWGKTLFCCILSAEYAIGDKNADQSQGRYVYFAPEYKFLFDAGEIFITVAAEIVRETVSATNRFGHETGNPRKFARK